jgi:hypothetical protein
MRLSWKEGQKERQKRKKCRRQKVHHFSTIVARPATPFVDLKTALVCVCGRPSNALFVLCFCVCCTRDGLVLFIRCRLRV